MNLVPFLVRSSPVVPSSPRPLIPLPLVLSSVPPPLLLERPDVLPHPSAPARPQPSDILRHLPPIPSSPHPSLSRPLVSSSFASSSGRPSSPRLLIPSSLASSSALVSSFLIPSTRPLVLYPSSTRPLVYCRFVARRSLVPSSRRPLVSLSARPPSPRPLVGSPPVPLRTSGRVPSSVHLHPPPTV